MTTLTLFTALLTFALTIGVLWVNPHRFSNQVFALVTLIQTISLAIVYYAKTIAEVRPPDYIDQFEALLRANAAAIAFLPASVWLLKNAIISRGDRGNAVRKSVPLFILSIITVCFCYSDSFIFSNGGELLQRGPAYYIYSVMALAVYATCLTQVLGQMRANTGIRRVELQFLALNIGGAALMLAALNALGNYFEFPALKSAGVVLMFIASALTAWALLFHRVFNAGELLLQLGQRMSFVFVLAGGVYIICQVTMLVLDEPLSLVVSVGFFGPVAIWIDRKSRDWFENSSRKKLAVLCRTTIQIASTEFETKKLIARFEDLLRMECRVVRGTLLVDDGNFYRGRDFLTTKDCAALQAAIELGWATPESLARRRPTPQLDDLQNLLATNSLGLLLSAPRGNPTPTVLVALGVRVDESPFTYPEIQRLRNVAELMGGLLLRSKVLSQAAVKAQLDYMAMASRGLAHDLKNLITPVSTFFVCTEGQYPRESAKGELHATASRAIRVMTDYVREAQFFSEQLRPRFAPINLFEVALVVREIAETRAATRRVILTVHATRDVSIVADDILLQRALANLVHNAIDASPADNEVMITITSGCAGWAQLRIADKGTGISAENLPRIFDPYFTTKNFGEDVRGIGLGLTVAQKIIFLHGGKISVSSQLRAGTTFIVDLPLQQTNAPIRFEIAAE